MNTNRQATIIAYLLVIVGAPLCLYGMFTSNFPPGIYGALLTSVGISFIITLAAHKDTLNIIEELILHERERKVEP